MTDTYRGSLSTQQYTTLETTDSAIAMVDSEGRVVAWTSAAQRLVGYSAREVVGQPVWFVMPLSRSMWQVQAFVEECRVRGGWSGTTAVRHRDGRTLQVGVRISLLWGLDGNVHWLVSGTDIAALSSSATTGSVRESLLMRTPIGVVVRDLELRCTWVNEVMERLDGVPHGRRLGCRLTDARPGFESEALEAVMRQALNSGIRAAYEYRASPVDDQCRERALAASFFCLHDSQGRPLGVCSLTVDVTSSRRAHERLAILSEAGTRIGSTLDVMETGQELADLAVPLLADYAVVDLAECVRLGEEPTVPVRSAGECRQTFRRAGLASIHSGTPESPWARGDLILVPPTSPWIKVLSSGSSHLEPVLDTSPGTWVDLDPARARAIREHGMHSMMLVPILARHAVLGVALFIRSEDPEPFQEDDLLLAEELVTRAALSLDNARQYTREHATALALQRSLLPQRSRSGTAIEAASRYLPADAGNGVGGDWFDVIPLSGARVALVIGDVVGHGINAAATMGRLRTAVRTLADMDLAPDELLTHLDDTVRHQADEDADVDNGACAAVGATCLYAVYDPVLRRCTMARAGHPPPAVVDPQGRVTFPDLPSGAPLGIGSVPFESVDVDLPDGSLLTLYTDGLVEARESDIDTGMRQLGATLAAQPQRSLEALCSAVIEALPTRSPSDDITLLVARTHSLTPVQTVSWNLPRDPAVVCRARALVTRQLTQWGLENLAIDTQLITSELVTNAIRHGAGPVSLRLIKHRLLTCEVSDAGKSFPRLRHTCSSDEGGRGILLVSQLSHRWGSRWTTGGKVVWAEQDLPEHG
ncbi:SpoIIE family protein phosphatase [Streptomyces sp. PA03-5A]|nr:SpoIIE family protein phosphatase [Streptomyces sp. PA03-5A]